MKKVYQTIIDNRNGNCVQACIATVVGAELADVPEISPLNWQKSVLHYFAERGYLWLNIPVTPAKLKQFLTTNKHLNATCLLAVRSEHFVNCMHCVVGEITCGVLTVIHDPNPRNEVKPIDCYEIFELDLFFGGDALWHGI